MSSITQIVPGTPFGCTTYKNLDVDETGVLVAGGEHNIYGFIVTNNNAAKLFLKFYNKLTAPAVGTDTPLATIQIGPGVVVPYSITQGWHFTLGIGVGATTGVADNNTGAPGTNDIILTILYK